MQECSNRPDDDRPHITLFCSKFVNDSARKQHGDGINKLKDGCDVGIIIIGPVVFLSKSRLQQTQYLTVEVVDGCCKEQQCTDGPPVFTNRFIYVGGSGWLR